MDYKGYLNPIKKENKIIPSSIRAGLVQRIDSIILTTMKIVQLEIFAGYARAGKKNISRSQRIQKINYVSFTLISKNITESLWSTKMTILRSSECVLLKN